MAQVLDHRINSPAERKADFLGTLPETPTTQEPAASAAAAALSQKLFEDMDFASPCQEVTQGPPLVIPPNPPLTSHREKGGVDTLGGAFRGTWDRMQQEDAFRYLDERLAVAEAQEENVEFIFPSGDVAALAPWGPPPIPFEGRYRWLITIMGTSILIADRRGRVYRPETRPPDVRVRWSSLMLMTYGHVRAWQIVVDLLASLGYRADITECKPSDLHICADLLRPVDEFCSAYANDCYVTDARDSNLHRRHRKASGITAGSRAATQMCIYDKLAELKDKWGPESQAKQDVMEQVRWGGEIPQHATRVEFRFSRDVLHEQGIDTMDQLFKMLPYLARWSTQLWFRLTKAAPDRENRNQGREEIAECWVETARAFESWTGPEVYARKAVERTELQTARLIKIIQGLEATVVAQSASGAKDLAAYYRAKADALDADVAQGYARWERCIPFLGRDGEPHEAVEVNDHREGPAVQADIELCAHRWDKVQRRRSRYLARIGDLQWADLGADLGEPGPTPGVS